ncbi:hypothetical protein SUGI_1200640 [Cryptomeria japonica]|uniref:protein SRC2-like n=1 Tax=Cryptomeria japonica TaxID=3369 RepID=UPI00241488A1|nr:protein SRC2-like [Cryptomeria japonica]GLJ55922.1 hypothetical protein SUGI_1200640 [Cryptomeria japonica]
MNTRRLEITVISADDLENVRRLGRRMHTYAIVSTDDVCSQCASTHIDEEGGCDPVWNDKLQLSLSKGLPIALNIQIFCKTRYGQRSVGWSSVPLSEILNGFGPPHGLHCLSYRLKTRNGRPHGTVNFSLRFLQHINPPEFFINSPISTRLSQQGGYENSSRIEQQNTALGGVSIGYPSSSPFGNANHLYPVPLSVYPPPQHNQIYAIN